MNFDKGQIYQWGQPEEWVCDLAVCVRGSNWGEPGGSSPSTRVLSQVIQINTWRAWGLSPSSTAVLSLREEVSRSNRLKELEEELKGSARRSSGLWRRGIAGRWEGGEHSPWGAIWVFCLRRSKVSLVVTLTFCTFCLFVLVSVWVLMCASLLLFVSHRSKPHSCYQHVIRTWRLKHVVQKKSE